ncbi:MAG: hypothetical protein ACRC33_21350, partial [Gemmataceae bacterium]
MIARRMTARLRLEGLGDRTVPATITLLNNLGTVDWSNANSWDLGRAPLAGDTVVLGTGTTTSVRMMNAGGPKNETVSGVVVEPNYGGEIDLSGATLTVTAGLTLSGGTVKGGGSLIVKDNANAATFNWYGGTIKDVSVSVGGGVGVGTTASARRIGQKSRDSVVRYGQHGGKNRCSNAGNAHLLGVLCALAVG